MDNKKLSTITASLKNTTLIRRRTFLAGLGAAAALPATSLLSPRKARAEILDIEKDELKFGFIKLTDMAPLAVAAEK